MSKPTKGRRSFGNRRSGSDSSAEVLLCEGRRECSSTAVKLGANAREDSGAVARSRPWSLVGSDLKAGV